MGHQSLANAVVRSLKLWQLSSEFEENLIDRSRTRALVRDETDYWDYKEELGLDNPTSVANLAKDMLGFHNRKGGAIIVGINKTNDLVGFPKSMIYDTAKIRDKTRPYTGPNVNLFQSTIDLPGVDRCVWVLFVPPREGLPAPALKNGPEKNGKLIFTKDTYFFRDGDQTKPCRDPNDYERLFADASFSHLQAYRYEVDEPFFRLLAPHCEQFVGRTKVLSAVQDLLDGRHWLITLDGVGGVGKTATAIELTRRLYDARMYDCIISLSAKNKVWTQGVSAVQAGFAGLTQLLREIAKVLTIDVNPDIEVLKQDVIQGLGGMRALLLIDNMEDVDDAGVLNFISNEIPDPVKVIVTSRIDKGWGGKTISVPEMDDAEAEDLLTREFQHFGYTQFVRERKDVRSVLEATGRIPLALKWAAALTQTSGSLASVVNRISKLTTSKREYLDFCFASMFDALSKNAKDVALLCPYLAGEWNTPTLAIALDLSEREVSEAIHELKDRGILLAATSRDGDAHAHQPLPLTIDFLRAKFNEHKGLRETVTKNLTDAMATDEHGGLLTNWPFERRLDFLEKRVVRLIAAGNFTMARKLARLGLNYLDQSSTRRWQFVFSDGQASYALGEKEVGLGQMRVAYNSINQVSGEQSLLAEQMLFLAEALFNHGDTTDEQLGLSVAVDAVEMAENVTEGTIKRFCEVALLTRKYTFIARLLRNVQARADRAATVYAVRALSSQFDDAQFVYTVDRPLTTALKQASKASWVPSAERLWYSEKATSLTKLLRDKS